MEALARELIARGVLDQQTLAFARAYEAEHGGSLDGALLELDLVSEQELLAGLESCFKMRAAHRDDIARADPTVGADFNEKLARSFDVCPLCLEDGALICLVKGPLPEESALELLELFGLVIRPHLAPEHYFGLARAAIYGVPLSETAVALEARLARRRQADVRAAVQSVERCESLGAAVEQVIAFAEQLLEYSCLLVYKNQRLRAAVTTGGKPAPGTTLPLPEPDCPLRAAILHGGYFFGQLSPTPGAKRFYESLQRPLPRWAFVAPVPSSSGASVVLCADNGSRGMALRTVAELALLVGRLGGRGSWELGRREPQAQGLRGGRHAAKPQNKVAETKPEETRPAPVQDEAAAPPGFQAPASPDSRASDEELLVLERLRQAAAQANKGLTAFVDDLLRQPEQPGHPGPDPSTALMVEVKGLFDKLATDIPAHFARGIEGAFKDLAGRLAPPPTSAAAVEAPRAPAAAQVQLVVKDAGPREVPSYQSRRRKTARVKL